MSPSAWPHSGSVKLPPAAVDYLKARGISLAAAKRAGVRYLTAEEAQRAVGKLDDETAADGLAFPFAGRETGMVRFLKAGAKPKIKQPYASEPRFYLGPFTERCDVDWDKVRKDPRITVYVTEGPVKGLCGTSHGLPTIALNGVWGWSRNHAPLDDFALFKWEGRVVVLCFDSDVVEKPDVQLALKRLAGVLLGLGATVEIKVLPRLGGANTGMDDLLATQGVDGFHAVPAYPATDARFNDWGADPATQELNGHHAFLMVEGKATILSELPDPDHPGTKIITLSRKDDVALLYANQRVPRGEPDKKNGQPKLVTKFQIWLQDPLRRQARRLWLKPGAPWGIDPTTGDFNIWQGWAVVPHAPDAHHHWQRLQDHIHEVLANGNDRHAAYVLDWMAFGVQHPDRLPEVAVATLGGEGTGKGIVWKSYARLFGRHAMQLVQAGQLTGNFNDHLKDKLFVFADEAFFAGDKASANALKAMITEPTTVIEPKFVNAYSLPNYKKIAIASNELWVVPADTDARRYAVFRVSEKRKGQLAYFEQLVSELATGGYEAMLHDLLHRDLSRFDPRKVPSTDALLDQKKLSWDEITTWWFERLCDGVLHAHETTWTGVLAHSAAQHELEQRITSRYDRRAFETRIGQTLNKLCPLVRNERRMNKVTSNRPWVYVFPSLKVCRHAFEQAVRMKIDWQTGGLVTGDAP